MITTSISILEAKTDVMQEFYNLMQSWELLCQQATIHDITEAVVLHYPIETMDHTSKDIPMVGCELYNRSGR